MLARLVPVQSKRLANSHWVKMPCKRELKLLELERVVQIPDAPTPPVVQISNAARYDEVTLRDQRPPPVVAP